MHGDQLHTIVEDGQEQAEAAGALGGERAERWAIEEDFHKLVRYRAAVKALYTRYATTARAFVREACDRQAVEKQRRRLVEEFDKVEQRHGRLLQFAPPEQIPLEDNWFLRSAEEHQQVMSEIDTYLADLPRPAKTADGSIRSTNSSRSTRTLMAKMSTVMSELAAAQLQLQHLQEEDEIREEEERKIRELEAAKDRIERARNRRRVSNKVAEKALEASILRSSLEEENAVTPEPNLTEMGVMDAEQSQPVLDGHETSGRMSSLSMRGSFARFGRFFGFTPNRTRSPSGVSNAASVADTSGALGARRSSSATAQEKGPAASSKGPMASSNGPEAASNGPTTSSNGPTTSSNGPASSHGPAASANGPAASSNGLPAPAAAMAAASSHQAKTNKPPLSSKRSAAQPVQLTVDDDGLSQSNLLGVSGAQQTIQATVPISSAGVYPTNSSVALTNTISQALPDRRLSANTASFAPRTSSMLMGNQGGANTSNNAGWSHPLPGSAGAFGARQQVPSCTQLGMRQSFQHDGYEERQPAVIYPPEHTSTYGPPSRVYGARPREQVYSADGWIGDIDRYRSAAPSAARSLARLPKLELPKFDGDPTRWPMFIQTFGAQVDRVCQDDTERLALLRNCLSEELQKHLGQSLLHPGLYHQCLIELQRRYGNPRVIAAACSKALMSLSTFRDHDFKALNTFSSALRSTVATLRLGGYGDEVRSNSSLSQVVSKLPPQLRSKWAEFSYGIEGRLPDLADLDTWLDAHVTAEYCVRAGCDSSAPVFFKERQEQKGGGRSFRPRTFAATETDGKSDGDRSSCARCEKLHPTRDCHLFRQLDVARRAELAKEKGLCFRCLESGHRMFKCTFEKRCSKEGCKGGHHTLLHGAPRPPSHRRSADANEKRSMLTVDASSRQEERTESVDVPYNGAAVSRTPRRLVLLPIVPVIISANGKSCQTFALLDTGSEVTMVCESVRKALDLDGPKEDCRIGSWHSQDPAFKTRRVAFDVSSVDGETQFSIVGGYTVPALNLSKRAIDWDRMAKKWPHLAKLPLSSSRPEEVKLLIGADHGDALDVFEYRKDSLRPNAPKGILTPFGWTVTGDVWSALHEEDETPRCNLATIMNTASLPLNDVMFDVDQYLLWDAYGANPSVKPPVSQEIIRCRQILDKTTVYLPEEGRYEAGVLWMEDEPCLPDNYKGTYDRFNRQMRRVEANPVLADVVTKDMGQNVEMGYARRMTKEEVEALPKGRSWYLPWHLVAHPHKPGKWRIVFDAAATFNGISLNSKLHKGEVTLVNLTAILIRFREGKVAVCGDITRMFYQVKVRPEDASIYLFLYKPPGEPGEPAVYQMTRHIFGAICSPAVCAHVLKKAAQEADPADAELATSQIEQGFYVDNWVTSFETEEEAIKNAEALTRALKRGGFEMGQWGSNRAQVLSSLPGQPVAALNLDLDALPTERTLGMALDFSSDEFVLKVTGSSECNTRRQILRATASNFDPLGLLAPVLVSSKLIMQRTGGMNVGWDTPLDATVVKEWVEWVTSLESVNELRIPRCLINEAYDPDGVDLLVFSDASERAYGAVAYFRFERLDGGVSVAFVMAKTKLAPMKFVSIPRLELCACLMATRLANTVAEDTRLKIRKVVLFTDSTTNLRWFNSKSCRFATYVANRVGEVLESFDATHWRYVPTQLNPADDLSRGIPAADLKVDHRYFTGPEFLLRPPADWPTLPDLELPSDAQPDPEIRAMKWAGAQRLDRRPIDELLNSVVPFSRVKRTVAFALRGAVGIYNRRSKQSRRLSSNVDPNAPSLPVALKGDRKAAVVVDVPQPSAENLENALRFLIRRAQRAAFHSEWKALEKGRPLDPGSAIVKTRPYLDRHGLLRVGGRIDVATVEFDTRHPVILPSKSNVTSRIIKAIHLRCGHSSPWRTLPEVQRSYWIPKPRRVIKTVVDGCPLCRRFAARASTPLMADLPRVRLQIGKPAFTATGVDYFGPIEVKVLRSKVKRWGCLFVCLTTGGAHLEMAYGLDTQSFLCALSNFRAARGTPRVICSDNGTNFIGAKRELAEMLDRLNQSAIYNSLALEGIEWIFNPPAAPHHGGAWERMVRSAKDALGKVMHRQIYTDQTLSCALKQVEHMLNSRPISYVSSDPLAPEPLTPFHLILGRPNPSLPPDIINAADMFSRRSWRQVQAVSEQFWHRWTRECLPALNDRRKWRTEERDLRVGDVVLLLGDKPARSQWPLGLITEVFPGPDGVVRSATVRHRGTELRRPAVKIFLLDQTMEQKPDGNDADASADATRRRAGDVPDSASGQDEASGLKA